MARTPDTMSEAIALSSPCGHMSKRARKAAIARLAAMLFPPGTFDRAVAQPSPKERDLAQAQQLRELAARGIKPRLYVREAARLEAKWP